MGASTHFLGGQPRGVPDCWRSWTRADTKFGIRNIVPPQRQLLAIARALYWLTRGDQCLRPSELSSTCSISDNKLLAIHNSCARIQYANNADTDHLEYR